MQSFKGTVSQHFIKHCCVHICSVRSHTKFHSYRFSRNAAIGMQSFHLLSTRIHPRFRSRAYLLHSRRAIRMRALIPLSSMHKMSCGSFNMQELACRVYGSGYRVFWRAGKSVIQNKYGNKAMKSPGGMAEQWQSARKKFWATVPLKDIL